MIGTRRSERAKRSLLRTDESYADLEDPDDDTQNTSILNLNRPAAVEEAVQIKIKKPLDPKAKMCIRRTIRVFLFLIYMFVIIFLLTLFTVNAVIDESGSLSATSNISITLKNCEVFFNGGSGSPKFRLRGQDGSLDYSTSSTSIKAKNTGNYLESCRLDIDGESFAGMAITCQETCNYYQETKNRLTFSGDFSVTAGEDSFAKFGPITMNKVDMDVGGTIFLKEILVSSTPNSLKTNQGDVFLLTPSEVNIAYKTFKSDYYCVYGGGINQKQAQTCQTESVKSGVSTIQVQRCTGEVDICTSGTTCSPTLTYNVDITDGTLYSSQTDGNGGFVSDGTTVQGNTVPTLNRNAANTVTEVKDLLSGDNAEDAIALFTFPDVKEDMYRWMLVSRKAYADFPVWWLGTVSAGLILPKLEEIPTLVPNLYCPYTSYTLSEPEFEAIYDGIFFAFDSNRDLSIVAQELLEAKDLWYHVSVDTKGRYHRKEIKISENQSLLMAFSISLTLGLAGSFVFVIGLFVGLKRFSATYMKQVEHEQRFLDMKKEADKGSSGAAAAAPGPLATSSKEEKGKKKKKKIKKNLPLPFSMPDFTINRLRKANTSSFELFISEVTEQVDPHRTPVGQMRTAALKSYYEAYCFMNQLKEDEIKANKDFLSKLGMRIIGQNDSSTEVFKKIRKKTAGELAEVGEPTQSQNENSLQFFIRCKYEITTFDIDRVFLRDFNVGYEHFCRINKVNDPVPITKRGMKDIGADFERLTLTVIKQEKKWRIRQEKLETCYKGVSEDPFQPGWIFIDLLSVTIHTIVMLVLLAPMAFILFFNLDTYAQYSARPSDQLLSFDDVGSAAWRFFDKFGHLPAYGVAILIFEALYLLICVYEIMTYYLTQSFPFDPKKILAEKRWWRRAGVFAFYTCTGVVMIFIAIMFVLLVVWAILAAVINPNIFLPYCAASGTFITFVSGQLSDIAKNFQKIFEAVKHHIKDKFMKGLKGTLDQIQSLNDQYAKAQEALQASPLGGFLHGDKLSERTMKMMQQQVEDQVSKGFGMDLQLAMGLLAGDPAAFRQLSEEFGLHPLVGRAVIGYIKKDLEAITSVGEDLARHPAIDIPPELARVFIKLAWKNNGSNRRTAVKLLASTFCKIAREQNPSFPTMDPRYIEAVEATARGDTSKLRQILRNHPSVPKQAIDILEMVYQLIETKRCPSIISYRFVSEYMGAGPVIANGLLGVIDDSYKPPQLENKDGNQTGGDVDGAFDEEEDPIAGIGEILGMGDPVLVRIAVTIAKGDISEIKELLPTLLLRFNDKFKTNLSAEFVKALMAFAEGTEVNMFTLARKHQLDIQAAQSLASLEMSDDIIKTFNLDVTRLSSVKITGAGDPNVTEIDSATERGSGSLHPVIGCLFKKALPNPANLVWLSNRLKVDPQMLSMIFAMLRGIGKSDRVYIEKTIQAIAFDSQLEPAKVEKLRALFFWVCCDDEKTMTECTETMNMENPDVTYLSKGFMSPDEFSIAKLTEMGFPAKHSLVRHAQDYNWEIHPAKCSQWCKDMGDLIVKQKSIDKKKAMRLRGQFLVSHAVPKLFIRQFLENQMEIHDDDFQTKIVTLLTIPYFPKMKPDRRRAAISNLANILELDFKKLDALLKVQLDRDNGGSREGATQNFLKQMGFSQAKCHAVADMMTSYKSKILNQMIAIQSMSQMAFSAGLPEVALAGLTPQLFPMLKEYPEYLKKYLVRISRDLGLKQNDIIRDLLGFVFWEPEKIKKMDKLFELQLRGTIPTLLRLFGKAEGEVMLNQVSDLFTRFNANARQTNNILALAAFASKHTEEFPIRFDPKSKLKTAAADCFTVLEESLGIHPLLLAGIVACSTKNLADSLEAMVSLVRLQRPGAFTVDESICRAIVSVANGTIEGIEDLCVQLKYDPDIAETMVTLSASNNISYSMLRTSSSFQKFTSKLGLDQNKIAGVLALAKCDMENAEDIAEELDPNSPIPVKFLKAIMSVYLYTSHDGTPTRNYDPYHKNKMVRNYIYPLAVLYGFKNGLIPTFFIRVIQGDQLVFSMVYQTLGLSGVQRDIYASLAALCHHRPFAEGVDSDKPHAWIAYKNRLSIITIVANLFKVDSVTLEHVVSVCRKTPMGLNFFKDQLKMKDHQAVTRLFEEILLGEAEEDSDDDEEDESDSDEDEIQNMVSENDDNTSQFSKMTNGSSLEVKAAKIETNMKRVIGVLNNASKLDDKEIHPWNEDILKSIIAMARAKKEYVKEIPRITKTISEVHEGNPPISMLGVRELLILVAGNYEEMQELIKDSTVSQEEFSFFRKFGLEYTDSIEIDFLFFIATKNVEWVSITSETDVVISTKVHSDESFLEAVASIVAIEPESIKEKSPYLLQKLELDMITSRLLLYICTRTLFMAQNGVVPITDRLEADPGITNGFLAHSYRLRTNKEFALTNIADKVGVDPHIIISIYFATRGEYDSWVKILIYHFELNKLDKEAAEKDDRVIMYRGLIQMLKKRWMMSINNEDLCDVSLEDLEWAAKSTQKPSGLASGLTGGLLGGKKRPKRTATKVMNDSTLVEMTSSKSSKKMKLKKAKTDVGSHKTMTRSLLTQKLGLSQLCKDSPFLQLLLPSNQAAPLPGLVLDVLVGIAINDTRAMSPIMMLFAISREKHDVLKALLQVYNRKPSTLVKATETVETFLENRIGQISTSPLTNIPVLYPGILQVIYGAIAGFPSLVGAGILKIAKMAKTDWAENFIPGAPEVLAALIQGRLNDPEFVEGELKDTVGKVFFQLLNDNKFDTSSAETSPRLLEGLPLILPLLRKDPSLFVQDGAKFFDLNLEILNEITALGTPDSEVEDFPLLSKMLAPHLKITPEAMNSILRIVANKVEDLDEGRLGMGTDLYNVAKMFADVLEPILKQNGLKVNMIPLLDGFFVACNDPGQHKDLILASLPDFLLLLIPSCPEEILFLVKGLVRMVQGDVDPELMSEGIELFGKALNFDTKIIQGLFAIPKGDWNALADLAGTLCDFDPEKLKSMVTFLKKLKILQGADEKKEGEDNENQEVSRAREVIASSAGSHSEEMFNMLDRDRSGSLDFDEFNELMKFYNLNLSKNRQLEIFTRFDIKKTGQMSVQQFEKALKYIEDKTTGDALDEVGMSYGALLKGFLGVVFILLMIFAFIFLGIAGFSNGGSFGAVVNSLLPISSGGILGSKKEDIEGKMKKVEEITDKVVDLLESKDV